MRKKNQKQMPLMPIDIEHPRAKALARIGEILDTIPTITDMCRNPHYGGMKEG